MHRSELSSNDPAGSITAYAPINKVSVFIKGGRALHGATHGHGQLHIRNINDVSRCSLRRSFMPFTFFDMQIIGRDRPHPQGAVATAWDGPSTWKLNSPRGRSTGAIVNCGTKSRRIKCSKVRIGPEIEHLFSPSPPDVTHFHHREI